MLKTLTRNIISAPFCLHSTVIDEFSYWTLSENIHILWWWCIINVSTCLWTLTPERIHFVYDLQSILYQFMCILPFFEKILINCRSLVSSRYHFVNQAAHQSKLYKIWIVLNIAFLTFSFEIWIFLLLEKVANEISTPLKVDKNGINISCY